MEIRRYRQSDCKELTELFYNTVHTVSAKDYTKEQLNIWATGQVDLEKWNQSLQEHFSVVQAILTVYLFMLIIREKGLLLRFAISWSRLFKEISSPMLLLQQDLFLKKEDIKL